MPRENRPRRATGFTQRGWRIIMSRPKLTVGLFVPDHIVGDWEFYQGGKPGGKHSLDLVRKQK
jgi:hypothetical protein